MTEEGSETLSRRTLLRAVAGGAVAAGASGAASAQETETETPTPTGDGTATGTPTGEGGDGTATGTPTGEGGDGGGGGGGFTWTVDMTDENVFIPEDLQVRPGDTVSWVNVGTVGHTVTAYEDDIPEEAEFFASGGFDSEEAARNGYPDSGVIGGGESYEHTFTVEGTHEYFCIPHESIGMLGTIEVTPDAPTPTPTPAPEVVGPALPESAKAVGVAAAAAMASTLGLAYAFIKYGGGGSADE